MKLADKKVGARKLKSRKSSGKTRGRKRKTKGVKKRVKIDVYNISSPDNTEGFAYVMEVEKKNCDHSLEMNFGMVKHLKGVYAKLGVSREQLVICVLNANDLNGVKFDEKLISYGEGSYWNETRSDDVPFVCGIATKNHAKKLLVGFDKESARKLGDTDGLSVVVVDNGVSEVYPAH